MNKQIQFANDPGPKAFSLVEMLLVLAIVGMLMAIAAPNLISMVQARTLSGEGATLRNQLTFALQEAISNNADVEVRFFRWSDQSAGDASPQFSAYQLYQYNNLGELKAISPFFRIRAPAVLSEMNSTLLSDFGKADADQKKYGFNAPTTGSDDAPRGLGGGQVKTDYVAFRFLPDGSTNLPSKGSRKDTWYLTLVEGAGATTGQLPRNYVCLQVNPFNGVVSEFRP